MKRWLLIGMVMLAFVAAVGACAPQTGPAAPTPVPEAKIAFAKGAFPPPMPDTEDHRGEWKITDCIKCHSEEAGEAPTVKHESLPEILLEVHCRTCHVLIREEKAQK